jgi:fumarate reductase flavoprotein subunit
VNEKVQKLVAEGKLKAAGSWDEMAAWIGCDPAVLKAEMDEYNSFCDKGRDEMFAKDLQYLVPLRKPPYYAAKFYAEVGETLGGIKVDGDMAVLDKQGDVIPGVFAAGVIADGHQGQTYCAELGGVAAGFAVYSGCIAGASAARFIAGK